jgi:membrane protein
VSYGAVAATVVWIMGSFRFSYYAVNFGAYNKIYGSVSAVIILMLRLYLSALVVLLGSALNAEIEHQSTDVSMVGELRPIDWRGAFVADIQYHQR